MTKNTVHITRIDTPATTDREKRESASRQTPQERWRIRYDDHQVTIVTSSSSASSMNTAVNLFSKTLERLAKR